MRVDFSSDSESELESEESIGRASYDLVRQANEDTLRRANNESVSRANIRKRRSTD